MPWLVQNYNHVNWGITNGLIMPDDDVPNFAHTTNNVGDHNFMGSVLVVELAGGGSATK